jgi:hypothetical protein
VTLQNAKSVYEAAAKKSAAERAAKTPAATGSATATLNGQSFEVKDGAVLIAAITSCTNTSNPQVLVAAGFAVVEGDGSRVWFEKDGLIALFHRPHPAKEAKPYQVRDARRVLELAGIRPPRPAHEKAGKPS